MKDTFKYILTAGMIITAAAGAEAKKPTEGDVVKTTMQTSRGWRPTIDTRCDAVMVYALGVINQYAETGAAPSLDEFKARLPRIVWTEA